MTTKNSPPTGLEWLSQILHKASGLALMSVFGSITTKIGGSLSELAGETPERKEWRSEPPRSSYGSGSYYKSGRSYNSGSSSWKDNTYDRKDDILSSY